MNIYTTIAVIWISVGLVGLKGDKDVAGLVAFFALIATSIIIFTTVQVR